MPRSDPPLDPDLPVAPVHLRPGLVLLVAVGGAVGTAMREFLTLAVPSVGDLPVAVLLINLLGAFLLGALLEALARRGPEDGRRRAVRLLLGTGFCGGFTTYSALAVATAQLAGHGAAGTGALYAGATLLLGTAATWAGIVVGARSRRR